MSAIYDFPEQYAALNEINDILLLGVISDQNFTTSLSTAWTHFGFLTKIDQLQKRFLNQFGIPPDVVNAWRYGHSAPSKALQFRVLRWWKKAYEDTYRFI